jgi:short-subunit dehydrogenase
MGCTACEQQSSLQRALHDQPQVSKSPQQTIHGLVTGASSGFGGEFARQNAERAHFLVRVARPAKPALNTADPLHRQYRIDVVWSTPSSRMLGAVSQLHRRLSEPGVAIDILINNSVMDRVRSPDRFWP